MNFLLLAGIASMILALCLAGLAIGLIVRNKNLNACGCGRGHDHRRPPGDCSSCSAGGETNG